VPLEHLERRLRRQQVALPAGDARVGVRVGEDPAEVRVAALRLAQEREVHVAGERHLGAGDRADAEVLRRVGELERAVDAVVIRECERLVAELGGLRGELLRQRRAVEERVRRVCMQLDVGHKIASCPIRSSAAPARARCTSAATATG
jgi:hypothetical protein